MEVVFDKTKCFVKGAFFDCLVTVEPHVVTVVPFRIHGVCFLEKSIFGSNGLELDNANFGR
eukprot:8040492-Karenia_brevis.AAC.1